METGTGKTYVYTKTIFELNRKYGFTKFIIVVPSVAIREGVYKSFQMTQEHFAEEYGKKVRFFIYNSAQLTEIDRFASDSSIKVMIINSQAFNAKGKDARRIYMKLDTFRSRRPIDVIAATHPILILDEATSSVDTHTEAIVQRGMDSLMRGRTVFVIAHRLSTVKNSDVIMVLDKGRIIERGNHEKLIAEKGQYYQLYTGAFELE